MAYAQRRVGARLWAVLLAAVLSIFGVATALVQPAQADPVTGRLVAGEDGGPAYKEGTASAVWLKAGNGNGSVDVTAGLFQLQVGDTVLYTYCIDLGTGAKATVDYDESGWDETIGTEKGAKITWILNHSVPTADLGAVQDAIHDDSLTEKQAVAATQAAIWHFSDGANLDDSGEHHGDEGNEAQVVALYKYLVENAEQNPSAEPAPALELSPSNLSGKAGEKIGPFKVATTAEQVEVSLKDGPDNAGLKLVDKSGAETAKAKDGDELFVDVPAGTDDGSVNVKAKASATVGVGRVFKGRERTQTMILAGSKPVEVCADAKASWSKGHDIPAAPSAEAKLDCKEGGVVITLTNEAEKGGKDATFTVEGKEFTVKPGESTEVLVKVEEDTDYSVTVTGSGDFSKTFKGHRNCEKETPAPSPTPSPAPGQPAPAPGGGLAHTGANNLPLQLGIGAALLLLGAGLVFYIRRRAGQQTAQAEE